MDPTGLSPGDVWLYQNDRSGISNVIWLAEKIAHPLTEKIYTHASMELKNGDQFTAHSDHGDGRGGSFVIDSRNDILSNQNGNQPRVIDLYRHKQSDTANIDKLDTIARAMADQYPGTYGAPNVCSGTTGVGADLAGLPLNSGSSLTPQSLSRDQNLKHVGSYNTGHTYTSPSGKTYSAPQSELPR